MTCGCSWTLPSAYPRYQIIGGEVGNGKQHRCDGFNVLIHGAQNPRYGDYSHLPLIHDSWLWISLSCLSIWSWEVGEPHGRAAAARGWTARVPASCPNKHRPANHRPTRALFLALESHFYLTCIMSFIFFFCVFLFFPLSRNQWHM